MVRGGWEEWQWDATLFAGAAPYYTRGRTPYAPGLAEAMAQALGLDGGGRLLDCGCGPGTVTLELADHFKEAIGLDPDGGMLAEAQRLASARSITNVRWVEMRAEELSGDLGRFQTITFAASFHWMDRPRIAALVRTLLEPGGAAVQIDAPGYRHSDDGPPLSHPPPPELAIDELRRRFLGADKRAGQGIRNTSPSGEDAVFQAAGFAPADVVMVPDGRQFVRTVDDLVHWVFSMSSTAPHLFGERLAEFERELRALLWRESEGGSFAVRLPDNELRIWRPV